MATGYILAIDQGTTSTRAIVFDKNQKIIGVGQKEFTQYFPKSGWVEHDADEIWQTVVATCKQALRKAKIKPSDISAIGITNQRETTVLWDRKTGKPVHKAIVWQDRRTAETCEKLKKAGHESAFTRKTGLLLDPYFSGTKAAWVLDRVKGLRKKAEAGQIAFGTIDSFLIWRLTGGKRHVTDATNASRTLMFNIKTNKWDKGLLDLLGVPPAVLPQVLDCADDFGIAEKSVLGAEIPILGVAGDQQAATIGNACFAPGMMKSTYGTGCFALLNTGGDMVRSKNRLLTTIAYRLNGKTTYALEGSIFMAGASVQWLRDGLKFMKAAAESGKMAASADPNQDVYLVPAFVGLGAPYWDAEARGALFGLTRGTGPNEIAKATLEAVCYQTHDLLTAMRKDWKSTGTRKTVLRVDGGMVASDWTMQFLADILNAPVDRPVVLETTALGAAWLAGSRAGVWPDKQGFAKTWALDTRFKPKMKAAERQRKLAGWQDAVSRTLSR
ncbi:glycerol kinase GlpK [Salaquimonas pukyongi]|uniref:glycerol kinase GlpK n=1 Tax=Salaquimonas pukyongi TaxID=2712698 RepID=UPI00096BAF79|nr:glycerol kinase GlpK [Salaquimonas pukyongi]